MDPLDTLPGDEELLWDLESLHGLQAGFADGRWDDKDFRILGQPPIGDTRQTYPFRDFRPVDVNSDGNAELGLTIMNDTRADGDNVFVLRLQDANPATANRGFIQDVFVFDEAPIDVPANTSYSTDIGMSTVGTIQTAIVLIRDDESPNRFTTGNNAANTYTFTDALNDTILLGDGNDVANAGGGNDIVFGQAGNDTLRGEGGNDMLFGNAGNDSLVGGDGADTLDGGAGADTLEGGTGNDVYIIDHLGDVIIDSVGTGDETVEVYNLVNYTLGNGLDFLNLRYGAVNGIGNDRNNRMVGNDENNRLEGLVGNDTLKGGDGNDSLYGGDGNDTLEGGSGNDSLYGGIGNDVLYADSRIFSARDRDYSTDVNLLVGDDGNDALYGADGRDTLQGGIGNDTLDGGEGPDRLEGGGGDDLYMIDNVGDVIVEAVGSGIDTVLSSLPNISLETYSLNLEHLTLNTAEPGRPVNNGTGNGLNNRIIGNDRPNQLNGLAGNDTLYGAAGDDTLDGGFGNDILYGGNGSDRLNGYGTVINNVSQFDTLVGGGGSDIFVLGSTAGVYYDEAGDGYAVIADWDPRSGATDTVFDRIEVNGSSGLYRLDQFRNVLGGAGLDTEIIYIPTGDRIGVIQDSVNVQIGRDFLFV